MIASARPWRARREAHSTLARPGGDEFVILLEGLSCPADATGIADRLLADLQAPIVVDDHQLFLQASVGIALGDQGHGRTPTEFLRDAHIAMYKPSRPAKAAAGSLSPRCTPTVLARNDLISDLRHAVSNDQLRVLYQPQIDVCCGRMVGVEALVRWQHPERGLLTPDRFLPLAESTGTIVAIDDWVLREACMQLRAWDEAGLEPLTMAVNVSAHRLVDGDLANTIAGVLHDTATEPARLEIELTETVAVEPDSERCRRSRACATSASRSRSTTSAWATRR